MIPESIRARLKSILELAERGTAGEQDNAQQMLEKLCRKYGVGLEELLDERTNPYEFKVRGVERILMRQVVVFICRTSQVRNIEKPKCSIYWLTPAQNVDVRECFEHYLDAWFRYREEAMHAFVVGNNLTVPKSGDEPEPELSPEELARIRRIGMMALTAGTKRWHRALPNHESTTPQDNGEPK